MELIMVGVVLRSLNLFCKSCFKLFRGQLKIKINHLLSRNLDSDPFRSLAFRDSICGLNCQYRLADICIGKQHAKLAFEPEFTKQHLWSRLRLGLGKPLIARLNKKEIRRSWI